MIDKASWPLLAGLITYSLTDGGLSGFLEAVAAAKTMETVLTNWRTILWAVLLVVLPVTALSTWESHRSMSELIFLVVVLVDTIFMNDDSSTEAVGSMGALTLVVLCVRVLGEKTPPMRSQSRVCLLMAFTIILPVWVNWMDTPEPGSCKAAPLSMLIYTLQSIAMVVAGVRIFAETQQSASNYGYLWCSFVMLFWVNPLNLHTVFHAWVGVDEKGYRKLLLVVIEAMHVGFWKTRVMKTVSEVLPLKALSEPYKNDQSASSIALTLCFWCLQLVHAAHNVDMCCHIWGRSSWWVILFVLARMAWFVWLGYASDVPAQMKAPEIVDTKQKRLVVSILPLEQAVCFTGFEVCITECGGKSTYTPFTKSQCNAINGILQFTVDDLTPATGYHAKVRGSNWLGSSDWSSESDWETTKKKPAEEHEAAEKKTAEEQEAAEKEAAEEQKAVVQQPATGPNVVQQPALHSPANAQMRAFIDPTYNYRSLKMQALTALRENFTCYKGERGVKSDAEAGYLRRLIADAGDTNSTKATIARTFQTDVDAYSARGNVMQPQANLRPTHPQPNVQSLASSAGQPLIPVRTRDQLAEEAHDANQRRQEEIHQLRCARLRGATSGRHANDRRRNVNARRGRSELSEEDDEEMHY